MKMKTPKAANVDLVFRAFSDRTRLRILNLLQGKDELCVCDIIAVISAPQAKISRHLGYLRRSGLVAARKDGLWVYYRLLPATGSFHKKMLECLTCCMGEVPELKADREKLKGTDTKSGGCCG